jgi:hypothetical protein
MDQYTIVLTLLKKICSKRKTIETMTFDYKKTRIQLAVQTFIFVVTISAHSHRYNQLQKYGETGLHIY